MAGVKVHDKLAEATVEVAPAEAQDRWLQGDVALAEPSVRVKRGLATGSVASTDLATALAEGWSLSDDDEAAALSLRRQESDASSMALGAVERTLAGATLGLSTLAETELLGMDPEAIAARGEGLGGLGTALEVAGGIAPGLLTGGAGTAASAARTAGSRGLGAMAARAVTSPARALTGLGAGTEAALAGRMAGRAGSTLVPIAGRGFVEGVGFNVGTQIDESALGERELVAEQLASDALLAGLFGAGAGFAIPGIASVGAGAARSSAAGMRRVMGRARGVDDAGEAIAAAANKPGMLERIARAQARATGADEDAAGRLIQAMRDEGGLVDDVFRNEAKVTQEIAGDVRRAWSLVDDSADDVMSGALSLKPQQLRKVIPAAADDVAPRDSAEFVSSMRAEIEGARAYNANAPGSYVSRDLDRLDDAAKSAAFELGEGVDAAHAMVTLGKLRKRVGEVATDTGGFGKRPMGTSDAAWETNRQARALYSKIREKLRDESLWGGGAKLQAEIDDSISAFHNARDGFREAHRGGFGSSLAGGGGPSADQAIKLVRSYGRFGGEAKVGALEDLLAKRVAQLRIVQQHFELDDVARSKIDDAIRGADDVSRALSKNARRAQIADDYRNLRDAGTDKSPSAQMFSTAAPMVLGALGMGAGGPVGAAAGMVLGAATRPDVTMRWLSRLRVLGTLDGRAASVSDRLDKIVTRATSRMSGDKAGRARAAGAVGAQAARPSRTERRRLVDEARTRAARYATDPTAIGRETELALYDVDAHAPGVAAAIRQRGQIAAQYLATHVPRIVESPFTGRPPIVDDAELARFERRVAAVSDPVGVIEDGLEDGTLTLEHVDAVREVYPQIYQRLQRDIVGAAMASAGRGEAMPYRDRIRLGVLFDLPLDPSLEQASLARTHAVFAAVSARGQGAPAAGGGGPPGRPGQLSAPGQNETSLQKLTAGKSA